MAGPEAKIVKKIQRKIKEDYGTDIWIFKTHGSADQIRGLPDLVGTYRGFFIAMEVKKPGGQLTDLQTFTIQKIKAAGGYATMITSYEEAQDFLGTVPEPPEEALGERD